MMKIYKLYLKKLYFEKRTIIFCMWCIYSLYTFGYFLLLEGTVQQGELNSIFVMEEPTYLNMATIPLFLILVNQCEQGFNPYLLVRMNDKSSVSVIHTLSLTGLALIVSLLFSMYHEIALYVLELENTTPYFKFVIFLEGSVSLFLAGNLYLLCHQWLKSSVVSVFLVMSFFFILGNSRMTTGQPLLNLLEFNAFCGNGIFSGRGLFVLGLGLCIMTIRYITAGREDILR